MYLHQFDNFLFLWKKNCCLIIYLTKIISFIFCDFEKRIFFFIEMHDSLLENNFIYFLYFKQFSTIHAYFMKILLYIGQKWPCNYFNSIHSFSWIIFTLFILTKIISFIFCEFLSLLEKCTIILNNKLLFSEKCHYF